MKNLENVYHGLRYVGYPCMNRTLRERSPPIRANRGLQMKTLEQKGLSYVSSLIEQNLKDLRTILQWNVDNNIFFYRCTSNLFPKNSQYEIDNIPNYSSINSLCQEIGDFIKENNVRLSFHPDHWVKLASPTQSVVENSLETIEITQSGIHYLGWNQARYIRSIFILAHTILTKTQQEIG